MYQVFFLLKRKYANTYVLFFAYEIILLFLSLEILCLDNKSYFCAESKLL